MVLVIPIIVLLGRRSLGVVGHFGFSLDHVHGLDIAVIIKGIIGMFVASASTLWIEVIRCGSWVGFAGVRADCRRQAFEGLDTRCYCLKSEGMSAW